MTTLATVFAWLGLTAGVVGLLMLACLLSERFATWAEAVALELVLCATFAAFVLEEWVYWCGGVFCRGVAALIFHARQHLQRLWVWIARGLKSHPAGPGRGASPISGPWRAPAGRPGVSPLHGAN